MQMTLGEIPLEEMKEVWYGEGFEEGEAKGLSKGIAQGISQGISQGVSKGRTDIIKVFMNNTHDAMLVATSLSEPIDYIEKIARDNNIALK